MAGRLLTGLVLLIAAACAGGGWYFANEIHARALDGAERRASLALEPNVRIASVGEETVTLAPIDDDPLRGCTNRVTRREQKVLS